MAWILGADIGGTRARFVSVPLTDDGRGLDSAVAVHDWACDDHASPEALLEAALADVSAPPEAIALAVAGPVSDGNTLKLTNRPWTFDAKALSDRCDRPVLLANDLHALARAIPAMPASAFIELGGERAKQGLVLVVGLGTGLGTALLDLDSHRTWPGEGGHTDIAPVTPLEAEIVQRLRSRGERATLEALLSGPGLLHLYRTLAEIRESPSTADSPASIVAAAREGDPLCARTLDVHAGLLGAATGNLVMAIGARGGVVLSGGMPPRLQPELEAGTFRARFEDRARLQEWIRPVQTRLLHQHGAAAEGAAWLWLDHEGRTGVPVSPAACIVGRAT